jgi:drug/metabolite transporter (DMT)-like permease
VRLALLVVQVCFAGFHVVAKSVIGDFPALALISLRVAIATPILLWLAWRRDRLIPALREWPQLALLGFLGVCLNQILFIEGLERSTATNAAVLTSTIPVFAIAIAATFRLERITRNRLLGIALAVLGAIVVIDPRRVSLQEGGEGNLLILANCLAYAGYLVLQRPVLRRLPWRTVVAWASLFGGVGVLAVGLPTLISLDASAYTPGVVAGALYVSLLGTVVAYSLNMWAVRRSSPSLAAAYTTLQPLLTAALAIPFLGEIPSLQQAVGGATILGGLIWASRSGERATTNPEAGFDP